MAKIIRSNGNIEHTKPQSGDCFELKELQSIVNGHIEIVNLYDSDLILVINEEGKIKGLEYNEFATELARIYDAIYPSDVIVGDVLLCRNDEIR